MVMKNELESSGMTEPNEKLEGHPSPPKSDSPNQERLLPSEVLFQGQREVWIEHSGVRYRLRITRRNRLILQK
jgi:hemin uptake protein HemP